MNEKPAKLPKLPTPPSLGATLNAKWMELASNDLRNKPTYVCNQFGQAYGEAQLWPALIVPGKELEMYEGPNPYTCVTCRGTGISPIAEKLENNISDFSDHLDTFFSCSACAGKGKPPISWRDLM